MLPDPPTSGPWPPPPPDPPSAPVPMLLLAPPPLPPPADVIVVEPAKTEASPEVAQGIPVPAPPTVTG